MFSTDSNVNTKQSSASISGVGLFSPKGDVLLHLRDQLPGVHQPGKWALIGGHIEPGETPREAVARELSEETGIRGVQFEELIKVPAGTSLYYLYWGVIEETGSPPPVSEGREVRWFPLEEALALETLTDLASLFLSTVKSIEVIRRDRGSSSMFVSVD